MALVRGIAGRIRSHNLTLNGSLRSAVILNDYLRSVSSDCVRLSRDDVFRAAETATLDAFSHFPSEPDDIVSAVDHTAAYVRHVIHCDKHTGLFGKCLDVMSNHSIFQTCSIDTKLKVLSIVFNHFRNHPQADPREVFLMDIYLRSMSNNDSKIDITKAEILSRVLNVVQSYPKVALHYKVTEETHLRNDLGFGDFDCEQVQKALYFEFKQKLARFEVENSCKETVHCIYECMEKYAGSELNFREWNIDGHVFWPTRM